MYLPLNSSEVAIFNKEPVYFIHWNFEKFFLMVDNGEKVITTESFRNATELVGRAMAVKALRNLNNLKAQELGHADLVNREILIAREEPEQETGEEE